MKLGKKPFQADKRDLLFKNYKVAAALPARPKSFGHQALISDWGMLGNDAVGDCVVAGGCHETMLWTAEGGKPAAFTEDNALSDYGAITGYDPQDPSSDQGTVIRTALLYRKKDGLIDSYNNRHKIGAFLQLDQTDIDEILEAIYLFSAIAVGLQMPKSALEQFEAGEPWTIVNDSPLAGGHYVCCVGYDQDYLYCVTWGKIQRLDFSFFQKYCDEAWAILSPEFLNGQGLSPEGFDLAQLQADLNAITNSPIPDPLIYHTANQKGLWCLQIGGNFSYKPKALQLINRLNEQGIEAYLGTKSVPYKVVCGQSKDLSEIRKVQQKVKGLGYKNLIVYNSKV